VSRSAPRLWLGASVRDIADSGEMSAFGLPGLAGVLVLEIPGGSALARSGLQKHDVILSINGTKIAGVAALLRQTAAPAAGRPLVLDISRNQKEITVALPPSR
jgi:S1-C subfamily serine protease